MIIDATFSYLFGLITGRGHLLQSSNSIAIEFSHANEFAEGIAHCPACGYLATKKEDIIKCKNPNCGKIVPESAKKKYNQPIETISSLNNVIIPFLSKSIKAKYQILGNKTMTLLVIDLSNDIDLFNKILHVFAPSTSFDRFHIPELIFKLKQDEKIEFINGLLDTSGFPSPGGWLNRDGLNGHGRMRAYFQIVRNWHLPVEIDNFLRSEFDLPTHTIDWGHPNIRDGGLSDYFNTNPKSWGREHQVKFFPEYYKMFKFRISSKNSLFKELLEHNTKVGFTEVDDWYPPSNITCGRLKAYHPGEADLRIPEPARRHFDAFWQINLAMGCKYLKHLQQTAVNPLSFAMTGDITTNKSPSEIELEFKVVRDALTKVAYEKSGASKSIIKTSKSVLQTRMDLEKATYQPLSNFFGSYLNNKYSEDIEIFDTSAGNLNLYLKNNNPKLLEVFEYCDKFRIRPDVVGFLTKSIKIVFIESKITPLDLKALGQLIGYCLVAQPEEAFLVSTVTPSLALIKILKARTDLLYYGNKNRIRLGQILKDGTVNLLEI